ncbi:MAG TPA: hypothetical protein VLC48_03270 [Gemmatimonadota bacterium]|nr:hypothetical protein [Gemmatimonadota bacterium]
MRRALIANLVVVFALLTPAAVLAQSEPAVPLLGNSGLGRPVQPLDARARGMGGAAVALHGANLSLVNPASMQGLAVSGVWVTFMPESRTVNGVVARGEIHTADFPLARMVIPFRDVWAVGVGFGSYLNQDWNVQFVDTLQLSTGPVAFQETRTSSGGISQLHVDVARRVSETWSLGLGGIYYFGKTALTVERAFASDANFRGYLATDGIKYDGWGVVLGTEWQPIPEMIVGLAGTWGAGLHLEADSSGAQKEFDQPFAIDLGASWRLTPDFTLALASGWTRWSTISDDLPKPGASDNWRFALGSELRLLSNQSTRVDGRLGGRLEQLPFRLRRGAPWERALSLGLGTMFRGGLGRIDLAYEIGKRGQKDTNEVEETFSRWTITLSVFSR